MRANEKAASVRDEKLYTQADLDFFSDNADDYFEMANAARAEADRAWAVLDWLAQNNPAALELCPYKATR